MDTMPLDVFSTPALSLTGLLAAGVRAAEETGTQLSLFGWFFYPLLFLAMGLAIFCVLTVHRQPHLSETQKLKWLLFTLFIPIVGPLAYWLRMRADRRELAESASSHSESEPAAQ
ncbi:PLD nuclease N-terminal domain-containing protein [Rothia nasimurium]|uniref:PLD nuclease N-terminal domain-containing protein n=2 Tax=Rothia nasimurium TaxID=85336 RepID=UPI001F35F4AA|nr:PLD nuclease N-terminal domain-containing protein [Rothia nasimurium]